MILHWLLMKSIIFESFGLWWPFLAFIGLFGLCGLGWFFKAETGLCWWKLSTIDLFSTIRCQNQSPNEIRHFESVCCNHVHTGKTGSTGFFTVRIDLQRVPCKPYMVWVCSVLRNLTKSCCKCEVELSLSAYILSIIFYYYLKFDPSDKIGSLHSFMNLIYFNCFFMKFILIMGSYSDLCGRLGRFRFVQGSIQGSFQGSVCFNERPEKVKEFIEIIKLMWN